MKEFVKKKAVIVKDRLGLPNYMTMFYMEPGTYNPEDVQNQKQDCPGNPYFTISQHRD